MRAALCASIWLPVQSTTLSDDQELTGVAILESGTFLLCIPSANSSVLHRRPPLKTLLPFSNLIVPFSTMAQPPKNYQVTSAWLNIPLNFFSTLYVLVFCKQYSLFI
jgi:hypothetical protein